MKTSDYRKAYEKRKSSREWKRAWASGHGIFLIVSCVCLSGVGFGALMASWVQ